MDCVCTLTVASWTGMLSCFKYPVECYIPATEKYYFGMYQMKRQLQCKYLRLNIVLEPAISVNSKLTFFEKSHECITLEYGNLKSWILFTIYPGTVKLVLGPSKPILWSERLFSAFVHGCKVPSTCSLHGCHHFLSYQETKGHFQREKVLWKGKTILVQKHPACPYGEGL